MNQLSDTDPMPIGKMFRGTPMQDIPAWHLFWWWTQKGLKYDKQSNVADYIRKNLNALQDEYKDGIW